MTTPPRVPSIPRRPPSFPRRREPSVFATNVTESPPARGRPRASRAGGFSLLEVLVAFVILALVATAIFGLYGGALRTVSTSEEWSRALLVAESRLALAASVQPLREGS